MPVVGAIIGAIAGALGGAGIVAVVLKTIVVGVLTWGLNKLSALIVGTPSAPKAGDLKDRGVEVTVRQSAAAWRLVYGRARIGGVITFLHEAGTNNEFLYMVITLCKGPIEAIDKIYFDGVEVPLDGSGNATGTYAGLVHVEKNLGTDAQTAFSGLTTDLPSLWTANHRQRGHAGIYVRMKWDEKFATGIPNITCDVRGFNDIADPRVPSTGYSENPALQARHYMTNAKFGLGAPTSRMNDTTVNAAANVCDESVTLKLGGTEPRYTGNGAFSASEQHGTVLQHMAVAMAGICTLSVGGKWEVHAGAYAAPTESLTDDDFRTSLRVQVRESRRDLFNAVRGVFVSPARSWQPTDFPPYISTAYATEDNGETLWTDIQLPLTISASTAQRISKIHLESIRRQITVYAPCKFGAYRFKPWDVVGITHSRWGWTDKPFRVLGMTLARDEETGEVGVDLALREIDSNVYAWNEATDETTPGSPSTPTLPNFQTVATPTGLTLASGDSNAISLDGIVRPRLRISWDQHTAQNVLQGGQIEIQWKATTGPQSTIWRNAPSVAGDLVEQYLTNVANATSYDVRIRARTAAGVPSAWTTVASHTVSVSASALPAGSVTEDATHGFIHPGYTDGSRRPTTLRRTSTDLAANSVFEKGVDTTDSVVDGTGTPLTGGTRAAGALTASGNLVSGKKVGGDGGVDGAIVSDAIVVSGSEGRVKPGRFIASNFGVEDTARTTLTQGDTTDTSGNWQQISTVDFNVPVGATSVSLYIKNNDASNPGAGSMGRPVAPYGIALHTGTPPSTPTHTTGGNAEVTITSPSGTKLTLYIKGTTGSNFDNLGCIVQQFGVKVFKVGTAA